VLAFAAEDDAHRPSDESAHQSEQAPQHQTPRPLAAPADRDKTLLRLFIAYAVLLHLGFSKERVVQCLLGGLEEGWEDALEWMWLHLSEDECMQRGAYAVKEGESGSGSFVGWRVS
jgi:ATP-dependent RNA helicase DHX29